MSKPVILMNRRMAQNEEQVASLAEQYDFRYSESSFEFAPAELAEADAVLLMGHVPIRRLEIASAPRLKIVAACSAGVDHIDCVAAEEAGVVVTNTPNLVNGATAEIAMCLMISVLRKVSAGERRIRAGTWSNRDINILMGNTLAGKTLGIVGLGGIGRAVAQRARAFEMHVIYHNRTQLTPELEAGARYVDMDTLLRESHVISVHVPLTPATRHLLSTPQFALMRPGAIVINTSRGAVIDEEAMIAALQNGTLAGAGLDVFEHEPNVPEALLRMEEVVVSPHIGTAAQETRCSMQQTALNNVRAVLAGQPPLTPVGR